MIIRSFQLICVLVLALTPAAKALPGDMAESLEPKPNTLESIRSNAFEILESMPDYLQTDTAFGGFPGKGLQYCAPVSVSNSLIWLAENGWPQLLPKAGDRKQDQHSLTAVLGSKEYMNTRPESGTAPNQVCEGVEKYLKDNGVRFLRIAYQGFRPVEKRFRDGRRPKIEELLKQLNPNRAVWLNIGWYGYDPQRNEYRREGGHWVTLVGNGPNRDEPHSMSLAIHDPARILKTEYIQLEPIAGGELVGDYPGLPQSAEGFMRTGGYSNRGIIDGVVILELAPKPVS